MIDRNLAIIRKSNSLVEATYRLSVNEQKLVLMLIASIKKDDNDFQSYIIPVQELNRFFGLAHNNTYQDVRKLVQGLQKKTFSIWNDDSVIDINWLSSAKYLFGSGTVELCIDPKLKPYLLNLKKCFTSYKYKEIAQLKSRFAIRIYELLKQYENLGERTFSLEDLRNSLGVEPEQYSLYTNFKNRVLLIAQRELKEKTSIAFDFEEIKTGRKVGKIRFIIRKQTLVQVENIDLTDIRDIISKEPDFEIDMAIALLPEEYKDKPSVKALIEAYLEKHDYNYVARNIAYTNDKSNAVNPGKSLNKKSNYRNYLKKALEKDFGLAYIDDLEEKTKEKQLQQEAEESRKKEEARKKSAEDAKAKNEDLIQNYLATLSKDEHEKLELEAVNRLKGEQREAVMNKKTGSSILLKVEIKQIVKERILKD